MEIWGGDHHDQVTAHLWPLVDRDNDQHQRTGDGYEDLACAHCICAKDSQQ